MAATVKVNVNVNDAEALVQLSNLDTKIDQLNKKSIDIKVNTGAAGSGSTKAATKEVRELDDVLAQAGFSTSQLGAQTKLTSRIVEGEVAKVVGTWEQGIGKTVKASSDGTVQVTEDYKKQAKESEKAAAVQEEATAKAWAGIKRVTKIGAAIATAFVAKQVKESLDTMKDVDTELANIRKVTGESAEAIAKLGNEAYETASKYGVTATEFLSSASDFAKAGYDNYSALAELAIKTQLVGDVTDETATKFLLSADAAYKFGGNVRKLSTVLDRANVIENNYATSIYKLAEGLPVVASTASMANMSIDELMAALGTITATTQETGRKAATALRALIMNITKQVGEVLEDENGSFEVTEESVKSMTDALRKYGSEAIKAAIATGDIVDPMEAIRSLATAYQNGDLSRSELFGILTDVGGKLRTNQLAALVENFSMFEEMLGLVEKSSGSADQEVSIMLDTWESKINQLDNKWTELVSHIADTSAIKGAIEGIIGLIDGLDSAITAINENQVERAERKQEETEKSYNELFGEGTAYREEMDALASRYATLNDFEKQRLAYLYEQEKSMRSQVEDARDLTKAQKLDYINETVYGENLWENGEFVGTESWGRAYKMLQDFQRDFNQAVVEDGSKNRREIADSLQETLDAYSSFYSMVSELRDAGEDVGQDALDFASAYEEALNELPNAVQRAVEEEKILDEPVEIPVTPKLTEGLAPEHGETKAVEEAIQSQVTEPVEVDVPVQFNYDIDNAKSGAEQDALEAGLRQKLQDVAEDVGEDSELEVRIEGIDESTDDVDGLVESISEIPGITEVEFEDNAIVCKGQVDALHEAVSGLPDSKTITISIVTKGSLPNVTPHASGTKNAPGGLALVNELGPELISDNGKAYIANGGKPAIVNLGKGAIVLTAEETKQAMGNAQIDKGISAYAFGIRTVNVMYTDGGSNASKINASHAFAKPTRGSAAIETTKKKSSSSNGSGGGGSGGGSGDSSSDSDDPWKDKEDALKDALDELDELAEWYHNQKKHTEEGNTYAEAIKKIDALRKEYLNAGFAETSKEVTALANKIYDYEKDIAEAKAHAIDDLEEELDILKSQIELAENQGDLNRMLELQNDAQKKVAQLIEAYRAAGFSDTSPEILKLANMGFDYASDSGSTMKDLWKNLIDAIEDMRDTQDDANTLAEKQLALDEAREALTNAQNQRTVRIFNPVTGQWEWVADAKSVKQAQENLTNAEQALLEEQQSQELNALKKAMENGGSLNDVSIGPGLSALLSGASLQQTDAFASALGLLSGGFAATADTSSKSIFDSVDSHDNVTQYTFNGVTIDAATAESTTLAQLTQMITPLALTNNMPA